MWSLQRASSEALTHMLCFQQNAAGDDAAYTEDRDWPTPVDTDDGKINPNQGVLMAAGVFRCGSFVSRTKLRLCAAARARMLQPLRLLQPIRSCSDYVLQHVQWICWGCRQRNSVVRAPCTVMFWNCSSMLYSVLQSATASSSTKRH